MSHSLRQFYAARQGEWDRLPADEKLAQATEVLQRAMAIRGYPEGAVPRIRVAAFASDSRIYVIVLRNQGNQRRRGVYISAMNLDALIRKVAFKDWTQLSGTRMEARFP